MSIPSLEAALVVNNVKFAYYGNRAIQKLAQEPTPNLLPVGARNWTESYGK